MNKEIIKQICLETMHKEPTSVESCAVGLSNYVFIVEIDHRKYSIRCSTEKNAYQNTVRLLEKLLGIGILVPQVLFSGKAGQYDYVILTYIEGQELWAVYDSLTREDKKCLAKEIVQLQRKVAIGLLETTEGWSWLSFIHEILDRARALIKENGYFDEEKVMRIENQIPVLMGYFESVEPISYLDDVTTKNLLVKDGHISGIIDIDWIGIGDVLTFAALTYVALLNMECDTDYVRYILDEMNVDSRQYKAFRFYALMYCVDFMGERGTKYKDKTVEVNARIVDRLNTIYDQLWEEWINVR